MIESEPVVLPHGRLQPYRLRSSVNADKAFRQQPFRAV